MTPCVTQSGASIPTMGIVPYRSSGNLRTAFISMRMLMLLLKLSIHSQRSISFH